MQWESGRKKVRAGVELRKKIKQLAYGEFDYREPELSLSTERIEIELMEGKEVQGDFTIRSVNGRLRGFVSSTHPRMECLTPQFDGEEVRIRYQFHSEGLIEGDVRKGEFVIVCDRGEYNLSFVVSVSKKYMTTAVGKIKTIDDFVRLAQEDFNEAYQLFYSVNFPNLIKEEDVAERLLYEAIRKEIPSMQAVEAYLEGIGRKKPVEIHLEQEPAFFEALTSDMKETICLKKDGWGYACADVTCDADFIRLEKTVISTEDFLGSNYFYEYYIDAEALHAGKNAGRIRFAFAGRVLDYEIHIQNGAGVKKETTKRQCKLSLTQHYIDYRLKKIVTGVWAKESIRLLDELLEQEENNLYRLMKAQAFLANRQRQEARWILEDYKRNTEHRDTPEWGYYLYLCTLMEREETYVNRLTEQIEELFHTHAESSLLFWILLFVREDYYKYAGRRLKAVTRWMKEGYDSPFFYLEAYYLYMQDPYLLTRLGTQEVRILNWARKQKALTKDIAMQILQLASGENTFDEKIFALLLECYELADKEEAVTATCSYLIKGQKFEKKYHKWYAQGVAYEARITNLYEAYLLSADAESLNEMPKVVLMYFQYHNALSYSQLALLYVHIIKKKEKQRDVYHKYRRNIEQFAMSQIEAGHIDKNLAIIYNEMLPLGILNKELAEKFQDILFTHQLTVDKKFARAVVVQKQWKHIQYVPIADGVAYFTAYTDEYEILLLDESGHLYAGKECYEEHLLLDIECYHAMAKKLAPDAISYLVYDLHKKCKTGDFSTGDENGMAMILDSPYIREEWKARLLPAYIRHCAGKEFTGLTESFLLHANYKLLSADDRCFMIEQLIENRFFDQAYELILQYGYDAIGSAYRVTLCSYKIAQNDSDEDEFLLGLAADTFRLGKYNNVLLDYLCKFYNGTIRQMAHIRSAAGEFELDTYELEERIITQLLYTSDYIEQIAEIYEHYYKAGGKEIVCMAYLTYFARLYLVKDALVHTHVFEQTQYRIARYKEVNEVQKYALLKYYAGLDNLTEEQFAIADELLAECMASGVGFAFFRQLPSRLQNKYQLYDKFYIEHHMKPGIYAKLHYKCNGDSYHEEELKEVYDGIYVKEILLFFGDKVAYYITEMSTKMEQKVLISGQLENQDVCINQDKNRYAMLNEMAFNLTLQELDGLKQTMQEYHKKKNGTEAMFTLL